MCYKNSFLLCICSLSLSFDKKFLILMWPNCQIISFLTFKEPLPHARYSPVFSSKSSDFAFHINPELTFVCDVRKGPISNSFFPHGYPAVLALFPENFPLLYKISSLIYQGSRKPWVCFCSSPSVLTSRRGSYSRVSCLFL